MNVTTRTLRSVPANYRGESASGEVHSTREILLTRRFARALALVACLVAAPGFAKVSNPSAEKASHALQAAVITDALINEAAPSAVAAGERGFGLQPHSAFRAGGNATAAQTRSNSEQPAVLWLVALSLMALLWLGRRQDGGK